MDFESEVGRVLNLFVTTWQDPRGNEQLGFAAERQDFDTLLFAARTEDERKRDERQMEQDQWDFVPTMHFGRRCADPHYGSLRMYHIVGDLSEPLVVGDLWKAQVLKCSHHPDVARTKNGLRKVRYQVRPLQRDVHTYVQCDFEKGVITTERVCGSNRKTEDVSCDVRRARYLVDPDTLVDVLQAIVGDKPQEFYVPLRIVRFRDRIEEKRLKLRMAPDSRPIRQEFQGLPQASPQLTEALRRQRMIT